MRCAIYCRLSKEDEEKQMESESIQNQKALLLQYAQQQGWEVVRVYVDEDYSGVDRERPAFCAMLAHARQRRFNIVLCKTQSRFTRDMELVEKYIHYWFPLWGIRFVTAVDHVDTAVQGGKKTRQINGLINEWYLEDLSENIRAVLAHKRQEGQYIGAFAAFGYRKDPTDRHKLQVDPQAAEVVRNIYQWYLEGMGKQAIADRLNQDHIPSPAAYRCGMESGCWSKTAVGRILKNELYTGVMVQGKKRKSSYKSKQCRPVPQQEWVRVKGTHEAVISPEQFARVQQLLRQKSAVLRKAEPLPLAGKVHCTVCGRVLQKAQSQDRTYLRCPSCKGVCVRWEKLERLLEEKMQPWLPEKPHPVWLDILISKVEVGAVQKSGRYQEITICWKI